MSLLKIARMGHPVLMRRAEPVADPTAPAVAALVADMIETMDDAHGRGLAATQVHVPKRVVVFRPPPEREAEQGRQSSAADGVAVLINPEIEVLTTQTEDDWEGCLSVPGLRGIVPRPTRVRYRGQTLDGAVVEREATGLHARLVLHECDHLDGVLYPMRMRNLRRLVFESEMRRWQTSSDPTALESG